jgi:uncharacterized protein YmfQ (DUF2313 family)
MSPWSLLTSDDFLAVIRKLLPSGAAWPTDPLSTMMKYMGALADIMGAQQALAATLSEREADPSLTIELLPHWEVRYGLPDPCSPAGATLDQRHAALMSKIAATGGQSAAYYISVAAAMGVPITIETFTPFVAGSPCGAGLYGAPWRFAWRVHSPASSITHFHAGSGAGEPLATWGNAALICRIQRIKPAHTTVLFASP